MFDDCLLLTGYDPEEYQEVVERHHRIDAERRKQKQDMKETKRIEEEAIVLKKKDEKNNRKLTREKRKDLSGARSKGEASSSAADKADEAGSGGDNSASGSGSDSDSDSDYDRYLGSVAHMSSIVVSTVSHVLSSDGIEYVFIQLDMQSLRRVQNRKI